MHRTYRILALILLISAPVFADTVKINEMALSYVAGRDPVVFWNIQAPPLRNPRANTHDFSGIGTAASSEVLCGTSCALGDMVNLKFSGLQINRVEFNGTLYETIYLSGTLIFDSVLTRAGFRSHIFGTFTGCIDPQCSVVLFPMSVDLQGYPTINFARDPSGKLIVTSFLIQVPEPSSLALLATGLASIILRKKRAVGTPPTS